MLAVGRVLGVDRRFAAIQRETQSRAEAIPYGGSRIATARENKTAAGTEAALQDGGTMLYFARVSFIARNTPQPRCPIVAQGNGAAVVRAQLGMENRTRMGERPAD